MQVGEKRKLQEAKLWIWDLDGTLLHTIGDLQAAVNRVLEENNYPLQSSQEIERFLGDGVAMLMRRALPNEVSEEEHIQLLESFKKYYDEKLWEYSYVYPGCQEMLEFLSENNVKHAVLTNKPQRQADRLIEHFFPGSFEIVYGQVESRKRKPDPQALLDLVEAFGTRVEELVYLGDSEVDVKTAKNANVLSIACAWGFRSKETLLECAPDYLVESFDQLHKLYTE